MRSKIADSFYAHAARHPEKCAIWCDGQTRTYGEMARLVSQYSHLLLAHDVKYADHIAIPMNNSIESVALFFSAADLGLCLVPLNPTLPFEAMVTAIEASDIRHLIARKSFLKECQKHGGLPLQGMTLCLNAEFEGAVPFAEIEKMSTYRPESADLRGDESFILTMTSGSTGAPKPIDISQQNKVDRVYAHVREYGITADDRVLAATPLYHSLAERLVILPLMIGATAILLPRFTPRLWLECARQQAATFTIAVSAQLAQILPLLESDETAPIDSFRAIVSSSALLEPAVKRRLIERLKCEFHEMYGTSEVSTATTICFQKARHKEQSVGRPFEGVRLRILDDRGQDCPVGEMGEIAVASALTCKGYYKQTAQVMQATQGAFFLTGDLGRLDEDGYLYFMGRKKELIITGAVNVSPSDVDAVVAKLPGVAECAAFSYPDARLGEVVALAVVKEPEAGLTARQIQRYCAHHLADFQQPHHIFFVDALPKNAMGKLQRMKIIDVIPQHHGRN